MSEDPEPCNQSLRLGVGRVAEGPNELLCAPVGARALQNRPTFTRWSLSAFLQLERPVRVALDMACGTGQSALALTAAADSVITTDIPPSMLAQAPVHERIPYVAAMPHTISRQFDSAPLYFAPLP
jgi:hypothetical protein